MYYSIGQVSELLSVKIHVLRYWERSVPLISYRKNAYGRRVYGSHEVNLLFRLRYLLQEARYTIDSARRQLWRETEEIDPDLRACMAEIRDDLVSALVTVRSLRRTLAGQGNYRHMSSDEVVKNAGRTRIR